MDYENLVIDPKTLTGQQLDIIVEEICGNIRCNAQLMAEFKGRRYMQECIDEWNKQNQLLIRILTAAGALDVKEEE